MVVDMQGKRLKNKSRKTGWKTISPFLKKDGAMDRGGGYKNWEKEWLWNIS